MAKLGLADLDLEGKRVLVRVDFNVPMDDQQNIVDDRRIRASLPTIKKILSAGGTPILISHLGRPKGKPDPRYGLRPVADRLTAYVDAPIKFARDCVGDQAKMIVDNLKKGEVLLLETCASTRKGEQRREFGRRSPATPTSTSTTRSAARTAPTPPRRR